MCSYLCRYKGQDQVEDATAKDMHLQQEGGIAEEVRVREGVRRGEDKTRQDKTRQDKTRQDKTRQDKTRQDKTRAGVMVWRVMVW